MAAAIAMDDILKANQNFFGGETEAMVDLEQFLSSTSEEAITSLGHAPSWPFTVPSPTSSATLPGVVPVLPVQQQAAFTPPPPIPAIPRPSLLLPPAQKQAPVKRKGRDEAARSRRKQERKKQALRELEESLRKKSEEYRRLEQENLSLKHRNQILDRIISIRNHQLGLIKQPQGSSVMTAATALPSSIAEEDNAKDEAISVQEDSQEASDPVYLSSEIPVNTKAGILFGTMAKVTGFDDMGVDFYLSMTSGQFLSLYRRHLFRLSEHLQVLESNALYREQQRQQQQQPRLAQITCAGESLPQLPPNPHAKALAAAEQGLLNEACLVGRLYKFTSVHSPDVVSKQMVRHLETGVEGLPPVEHWRMLLQTLALTSEQQLDLLSAGQLYKRLMAKVLAERATLHARMTASGHTITQHDLKTMTHVPAECQVLTGLMRNLRQEKSLSWMLQGFFFGHTCTVMQFSKAIVYAYPYMPDVVAIVMTLWNDMEAANTLPPTLLS